MQEVQRLFKACQYTKAFACLKETIALEKNNPKAYRLLQVFFETRDFYSKSRAEEATTLLERGVGLVPKQNKTELTYRYGLLLYHFDEYEKALAVFADAAVKKFQLGGCLYYGALCCVYLSRLKDVTAMLASLRQLQGKEVEMAIEVIQAYSNLAQLKIAKAKQHFIKADEIAGVPMHERMLGRLAYALDERELGWQLMAKGRQVFLQKKAMTHFGRALKNIWHGQPLANKSLLVVAYEGVGDEVMAASLFAELEQQAKQLTVVADARLVSLFQRSFAGVKFLPSTRMTEINPDQFDYVIYEASLFEYMRKDLASFNGGAAYLQIDEQLLQKWQQRFAALPGKFRIGISWLANRGGSMQLLPCQQRCIDLLDWKVLLQLPEVSFVNLQYGDVSEQLQQVQDQLGVTVHDWEDADPLKDLDNFAAQLKALDLVISVDNTTVHFSGALGVATYLILPPLPDWRWQLGRDDCDWYAAVKLFRRDLKEDWRAVLQRSANCVEARLRAL